MLLSSDLKENIESLYKHQGTAWISELPKIINRLSSKWQLRNIEPVGNMSWNYVAKAFSAIYGECCLKIGISEREILNEIKILKHFSRHGAIDILNHDIHHRAILLDQAIPGFSLKHYSQTSDVLDTYIGVVEKLMEASKHRMINYPIVDEWCSVFTRIDNDMLPDNIINKALAISKRLLRRDEQKFLLHGDLHLENILSCTNTASQKHNQYNEWVVIDPKGVAGPKGFELAGFDFVTEKELAENKLLVEGFENKLQLISDKAHINKDTLRQWYLVRLVMSACWMIEDNLSPRKFINIIEALY